MKLKKILALILVGLLALTACSNGEETNTSSESTENTSSGENSSSGTSASNGESLTIGILQFAQHGSLDNCREGFIQGMEEKGYVEGENVTYDYQNANADTALVSQIADSFVANDYDLIVAIATPAAMGAYNAAKDSDIPAVYTAVTDPVEAGLADEEGNPLGNITGTSDELPVEAQLQLIRDMMPEATKLGIMYTTSEANSVTMIAQYEELVGDYGFELVTQPVSQTSDIPLATDSVLEEVDVMTNLLDNTVVNSLPTILEKANNKGIPVYGSEIEQVRIGCLGAEGVEYISLGKQTGEMAARILEGEEASSIPYEIISESNLYLNQAVADNLGIEIGQDLLDRASEVFTEIADPNQAE